MNIFLPGFVAACLYTVSAVLLGINIYHEFRSKTLIGSILPAALAIILHALVIHHLIFTDQGLNFSFFNSLTLVAWLISILLLLVSIKLPILNLALLLFPITALSILLAYCFPTAIPGNLPTEWIKVHIILSMVAYSVLSLASLQAIFLYIQDYRLHHHKQDRLTASMPALQKMEDILFTLISIGFILLTIALLTGLAFTEKFFTHKIIFSIIAWLVFAILLTGRWLAGWRGRIAIRWTIGGIFSLLLAFFGTKMVLEMIISR